MTRRQRSRRAVLVVAAQVPGAALAAACVGISGAPPATRCSPAAACLGQIDLVSPFNVRTPNGDGLVHVMDDFGAANAGCAATLLFVSANNTEILEKLVGAIVAGTPPAVALVPAQ